MMIRTVCLLATACVGVAACDDDPLMIRAEVPEGQPPPHLEVFFENYRTGVFAYDGVFCWFVPADRSPPRKDFHCGELLLGLQPGVSGDDLSGLIEKVDGTILRDRSDDDTTPRLLVGVPRFTEGTALLRLLLDARFRSGNLHWDGEPVS